jgi:hypothetical protein
VKMAMREISEAGMATIAEQQNSEKHGIAWRQ